MKKLQYFALIFISINIFGQNQIEKLNGLKMSNKEIVDLNDTIINVFYKKNIESEKKPAYFVNGLLANINIFKTINPNDIETVDVKKEKIEIENIKYYGQIYLITKSTYNPKYLSLNDLKLKYTNIRDNSIIFKIDDEIIYENYEKYLIDEKFVLRIVVEKFENKNEKLRVNIINLTTKTLENIKRIKEKMIR